MKESAFQDFSEEAQETLDFARCQRPDGSYYGTGGVCRKGSPSDAKEKEAPKGKSSGGGSGKGDAGVRERIKTIPGYEPPTNWDPKANNGKGATVSPKQAEKRRRKASASEGSDRATQANVRKMDKAAKDADKKATAADKTYQKAEKDSRKAETTAAKAQAALRKDPQNQSKKDAFRVANMDARNARDRAAILGKQTRKLDKEAKQVNKAAEKLDKEWRKSQGIK